MNPLLAVLLLSAVSQLPQQTTTEPPATTQATTQTADQTSPQTTTPQTTTPQTTPTTPQTTTPATPQGEGNRTIINVKPGAHAIKPKDYYGNTGYLHPFRRMPGFIFADQKAIWTSPFHTAKSDIKWWALFGGGTAALIATDKYVQKNAPNNSTLVRIGNDASYLGEAYTLIPISAGLYFLGTHEHKDHLRETGLLGFEALADVTVVFITVKEIADRARPLEGNGKGDFESSTSGRWNSSFPSGHAISTFALASVIAHEYPHHWWLKAIILGYGFGVAGARLAANRHFPGDVVAGGAIGWFVGDYVYAKRHNPDLEKGTGITQKIFSHLNLGGM